MILSISWGGYKTWTPKQLAERYIDIAREISHLSKQQTDGPELEAAQFELNNLLGFYEVHRCNGDTSRRQRWQLWLNERLQVNS